MKWAAACALCLMSATSPALAQGSIKTWAGDGVAAFSGDGGLATSAALNHAKGLTFDAAGNAYLADTDNLRIRRVTAGGMITTVTGNGIMSASGDGGLAVQAGISDVAGVAMDSAGNLYIADASNRRIRKVSGGIITTIAGIGVEGFSGDGGQATSAMLGRPVALALDSAGNLYFADSTSQRIRKIDRLGIITTVAGNGVDGYSGDGGQATLASLGFPLGVAVDAAGNVYVADADNSRIRKITPGGIISTVAGNGHGGFAGDGGLAINASINIPSDVTVDAAGNLYIADAGNNRVRKVDSSGTITTVAGTGSDGYSGDGGLATQAMLNYPWGVALDASGNLYVSDRVNNRVRLIAGAPMAAPFLTDNAAVNGASFVINQPIAPGAIVTIFGANLATSPASMSTPPLLTELAGTSVTFNGVSAPLFFVSAGQINAQAPFDMALGPVRVQVRRSGVVSVPTTSTSALFSPGIFIMDQLANTGAIVHSVDYALVTAANPARSGEYISIFATGLGPVSVPTASGTAAPSVPPFAETLTQPIVMIGGQSVKVSFSGLAPGFVGLYQINVAIPAGIAAGNQALQVSMFSGPGSNTVMLAIGH